MKIILLVSVLMLMRLQIYTSILDGVRALWRSVNNILLNLIVGDVFSEQSGKNQGNVWKQ